MPIGDSVNNAIYLPIVSLTNSSSPYTVLVNDAFLSVDSTAGTVTIWLPNAPLVGRTIIIKDSTGQSAANAINITTVGGIVTIDGQTTYTINTVYKSINVIFDGTKYEVY